MTETNNEQVDDAEDFNNPYKPFSVIVPYELRFSIKDDDKNTSVLIRTISQQVRFGRNEREIFLQHQIDSRYGKDIFTKHMLNWVDNRLHHVEPGDCRLDYIGKPKITELDHAEIEEFAADCLGNLDS